MKKKIKCWKSASENEMSLQEAINILRSLDTLTYPRAGIGKDAYHVIELDEIKERNFDLNDIISNSWMIYVPDTNAEEILEKVRKLVKNEHFLNKRYSAIDNMDINQIFSCIYQDVLSNTSDQVKYRLIKKLIEEKLYK